MHDPRPILGIQPSDKNVSAGVLVSSSGGGPPALMPGTVPESFFEGMVKDKHGIWRSKRHTARYATFMWPINGRNQRDHFGAMDFSWFATDNDFVSSHKFVDVPGFDFKKTDRLLNYVQANNSISLVIDNMKAAAGFFGAFRKKMSNEFPVYRHVQHSMPERGPSTKDDRLVLVLTFMNMPLCIPIYNTRKVNGMGLNAALLWEKSTESSKRVRMEEEFWILMSHEAANVLSIDGARFSSNQMTSGAVLDHIKHAAQLEVVRVSEKRPHKRVKKKSLYSELSEKKLSLKKKEADDWLFDVAKDAVKSKKKKKGGIVFSESESEGTFSSGESVSYISYTTMASSGNYGSSDTSS